jgi:hypothetical protein
VMGPRQPAPGRNEEKGGNVVHHCVRSVSPPPRRDAKDRHGLIMRRTHGATPSIAIETHRNPRPYALGCCLLLSAVVSVRPRFGTRR